MITSATDKSVDYSGDSQEFTIAANSNIFQTLSSRLYERPIEAIVREISSNAIDANIEAGKTGGINVHLPIDDELEFYVEDFGIGMDKNRVMKVYTQYGNSSKSGTNDLIGGLGLGSKTPFSYTDQFTIESCKDGLKTQYIAFMDETGIPKISEVASEACNVSGTKVSFPVKREDIDKFYDAAVKVFMFSKEMPNLINDEAKKKFKDVFRIKSTTKLEDGKDELSLEGFKKLREANKTASQINGLRLGDDAIYIEMGGVIYNVSSEVFDWEFNSALKYFIGNSEPILLHLPIGAVDIQASREKLNFTKRTMDTIKQNVKNAVQVILTELFEKIKSKDISMEEKIRLYKDYDLTRVSALEAII